MVGVVSGRNTKRGGQAAIWFSEPVDGSALVVAGDLLEERPEWAVLLAFEVGGGRTDLIGHAVIRTPAPWPPEPRGTDSPLVRFAALFAPAAERQHEHLTTAIVRAAATTGLEAFVRRTLRERAAPGYDTYAQKAWGQHVAPGEVDKRTQPRRRGDLRRAQIARRYVELLGQPENPKPILASELSLSINTVNSYLHQARERGLLTSDGRGRAGGQLTPLAHEILNTEEN